MDTILIAISLISTGLIITCTISYNRSNDRLMKQIDEENQQLLALLTNLSKISHEIEKKDLTQEEKKI